MSARWHSREHLAQQVIALATPGSAPSRSHSVSVVTQSTGCSWTTMCSASPCTMRCVKQARLSVRALPEQIICDPARGLDKPVLRELSNCHWVRAHHNVIAVGPTGIGKSQCAAQAECRQGFRALFLRVPRLLEELAMARASATYAATLAKLAKIDVLVLDDSLLAPMTDAERRDLIEILEDRYDQSSTVITTQLPTKSWHEALGDPTIADAICDRLVHYAHVVALRGPSMRRQKGMNMKPQPRRPEPLSDQPTQTVAALRR